MCGFFIFLGCISTFAKLIWYRVLIRICTFAFLFDVYIIQGVSASSLLLYQNLFAAQGDYFIDDTNFEFQINGPQMVTPLHWAVYHQCMDTVETLLELGADPFMYGAWFNYKGSPLDFAEQKRSCQEMIEAIQHTQGSIKQDKQRPHQHFQEHEDDEVSYRGIFVSK